MRKVCFEDRSSSLPHPSVSFVQWITPMTLPLWPYSYLRVFLYFFFRFPPAEGGGGTLVPMGKPILIALGPMGAAIVTKLVLKPHAEACCFGLFYSIVAIASLC